MTQTSCIVPNHGRDLKVLLESLPEGVERVIIDRGFERSKQRNMGILAATKPYLLILDSDQSISPGLVKECEDLMGAGYSCCYIPEVIIAKSWFGKVRKFEREFLTATAVDVPRFVRRSHCPLFDELQHGTEDSDWGNRIPGIRATTRNVLYHHDDIPFTEYCRKKAYYTKSIKRYKERNPVDKCTNIWYRCVTVYTEKGKIWKLCRHPHLAFGIFCLLLIRGLIYYANK